MTGTQLKQFRQKAGITGRQLAKAMKASAADICRIEKGHRQMTDGYEDRILKAALAISEQRVEVVKRASEQARLARVEKLQQRMDHKKRQDELDQLRAKYGLDKEGGGA